LAANCKLEDAARKLECSTSKVSRLENGKGVPRQRDVRDLLELYGPVARQRKEELLELVVESLSENEGIITDFRDVIEGVVSSEVSRYVALEQDARSISSFEPFLVPGLLQTAEYAQSVIPLFYPDRSAEEQRRLVALRMQRQEVLRRPGADRLKFAVVLAEQALRRPVGGPAVMRKQLEHLVGKLRGDLADIVEFRVAPLQLVHPGVLGGQFAVVEFMRGEDQDVVYLEGRDRATFLESAEQVRRYLDTFAALVEACPSRNESVALVEQVVEQMPS
jgi:transcriptional regulator with XRE-family HTH domain